MTKRIDPQNARDKRKTPAIRFDGFDEPWKLQKLGELGSIITGSTPSTSHKEYYSNSGIPWVTPTDIICNLINDTPRKLSVEGEKFARVVPANTILVTCIASIGKNALLQVRGSFNQQINSLTPNDKNDPYFLLSESEIWSATMKRQAAAATMQIVNKSEFSEHETYVPSKAEQLKIGAFFRALDDLITLRQRKYDKLVKVKKSMLEKLFPKNGSNVPEIRFSGFTGPWELRKLGEITSLITKGTTPLDKSGKGDINFVKIENIDSLSGKINPITKISFEEHEGYLKRSQLQENDILFSIAGTLGRVSAINKEILPANTNQALAIIRLKDGGLDYITTYLKGKAITDFVKKNPTVGAQPNLSLEQVRNLEIAFPSTEEQLSIGAFFRALDDLITLHHQELEKLQRVKKSFLEKMFV